MKHIKKFNENGEAAMLKMMGEFTVQLLLPILEMIPQEASKMGVSICDYFEHEDLDRRIDDLKGLYKRAEGVDDLQDLRDQCDAIFNKVEELKALDNEAS